MVRFKGIRKDSLKTRVIEDNLLGIARVPILSLVIRSLARCGKLHDGQNCDGVGL